MRHFLPKRSSSATATSCFKPAPAEQLAKPVQEPEPRQWLDAFLKRQGTLAQADAGSDTSDIVVIHWTGRAGGKVSTRPPSVHSKTEVVHTLVQSKSNHVLHSQFHTMRGITDAFKSELEPSSQSLPGLCGSPGPLESKQGVTMGIIYRRKVVSTDAFKMGWGALDAPSSNGSEDLGDLWQGRGPLLSLKRQLSLLNLFFKRQGHIDPRLAQPPLLRLSPDSFDPPSNQANQGTQIQSPPSGPALVESALVLRAVSAANSSPVAHSTKPPLSGEQKNLAPPT
ncbi:hypothetical protein M9458_053037 [Cirrhinus mrigala]|uniref:Uncharacterized protein n=1 Tax=Cirrhinus mrigala TaxID=683832 RepID=A0ABD0MSU8_CIRMR